MSNRTDAELLAELNEDDQGFQPVRSDQPAACHRLDVCMKCEWRSALICTRSSPSADSRMNISALIRRADATCPEGKWG